MIKLIASDVDGTLAPDGENTMDPSVFEMIRACRKAGIHFIVASGRPYAALKTAFAPVLEDVIFAADSGALVVHRGEVLHQSSIEPALGRSILEDVQARKNCEFMISAGRDYVYIMPKNLLYRWGSQRFLKGAVRIIRSLDALPQQYQKLSVYVYRKKAYEMTEVFKRLWGAQIPVLAAGNTWVDFSHTGKEHAIQAVMDKMHISPEELMVFGDSENDIGMMRLAGHAYAMESAPPQVKQVCAHRCTKVPPVVLGMLQAM